MTTGFWPWAGRNWKGHPLQGLLSQTSRLDRCAKERTHPAMPDIIQTHTIQVSRAYVSSDVSEFYFVVWKYFYDSACHEGRYMCYIISNDLFYSSLMFMWDGLCHGPPRKPNRTFIPSNRLMHLRPGQTTRAVVSLPHWSLISLESFLPEALVLRTYFDFHLPSLSIKVVLMCLSYQI